MITKEIAKMLIEQINLELHSAYIYLEFANYYESQNLPGFAHWYKVQAGEEYEHADRIRHFLIEAGETVTFSPIGDTVKGFKDAMGPLKEGLKHEQFITASINKIYEKAVSLKDHLSANFLQWFIKEQGEEETNAQNNIDKLEMVGLGGTALYLLDKEFARRED
ncbi:MAG: ferritin [Clostridiales bacterium]|jgi:ferritin|nr:ferritin [Clostridiales bacterium]